MWYVALSGGAVDQLLADFDRYLRDQGDVAKGDQIMDAAMVPVPRQHNTQDENTQFICHFLSC